MTDTMTTNSTSPVVRTGETPNVVQAEGVKKPQAPPSYVGVRKAFNNMGFEDKDIGFDNGVVTYKGQGVVQPSYVEDGTSYAPESANYAGALDYLKNNGYIGLREGLNNRGVADHRIGWNDNTGAVTIDGYDVAKPQYNVDGTTYVTESELNNIYSTASALAGDPIVAARDYAMSQTPGAGISVDWDGQNVLVGGQPIKPEYIEDGVAYVHQSQLDPLISDYKKSSGLDGRDKLKNRNFSYDLDSDEIWIDHRDRMTDLAEEAYRRVLNNSNMSAGSATGAVLAEANASMNDYLYKLADDAYTYRQDAYNRWNDDYERDYKLYRDDINDAYNANLLNSNEKWKWRNYEILKDDQAMKHDTHYRDIRASDLDYDFAIDDQAMKHDEHDRKIRSFDIQNDTDSYNYAMGIASTLGRFLPEHEAFIPGLASFRNSDGTYSITPTQYEMLYTEDLAKASAMGHLKAHKDVYGY